MQGDMMNTICRRALAHAFFASFAITAMPGHAAESRDTDAAANAAAADAAAMEVCATASSGMVPKAKLVNAIHRMLDMGETPRAAKLSKEEKRNMQFQVFWKELSRESEGG
jgi:hypothetical protein